MTILKLHTLKPGERILVEVYTTLFGGWNYAIYWRRPVPLMRDNGYGWRFIEFLWFEIARRKKENKS